MLGYVKWTAVIAGVSSGVSTAVAYSFDKAPAVGAAFGSVFGAINGVACSVLYALNREPVERCVPLRNMANVAVFLGGLTSGALLGKLAESAVGDAMNTEETAISISAMVIANGLIYGIFRNSRTDLQEDVRFVRLSAPT